MRLGPWGWFRLLGATTLGGLIVAGIAGQAVGDRSVGWALLMYMPLVPLGLATVVFDLLGRGRRLGWGRWRLPRFGLTGLGGLALVVGAVPLVGVGPGAGPTHAETDPAVVSVLHWNVLWGGGRTRNPESAARIRRAILDQPTDLVVLSEAAPDDWLDDLVAAMGPGATRVQIQNEPNAVQGYWFKLVVASRWPVRLVGRVPLTNGTGMAVEATVRGEPVRLLVTDGLSRPTLPRGPFLRSVATACTDAAAAGTPYDLVAGDFNCIGRSRGFTDLAAAGYDLAARSARGWRGTFPSFAPIYDIDHVWVRRDGGEVVGCRFFTEWASDHRGQVVRFRRSRSPGATVQLQHPVVAHLLGLGLDLDANSLQVGR